MNVSPSRGEEQAVTLVFRPPAPSVQQVSFTNTAPAPPLPALPAPPAPATPELAAQRATTRTPTPQFPRVGATSRAYFHALSEPQVTNQTRQALGFYGGYPARATLSQLPRRTPLRHSAPSARRPTKPFEVVHNEPTVSPYLNLHRDEQEEESAPNYFAFVRPQMEQLEANRLQQRAMQQLRGQLQTMSSTVAGPSYHDGRIPGTGTAARYMDTAQFYGRFPR
jgi:hypothetical protein